MLKRFFQFLILLTILTLIMVSVATETWPRLLKFYLQSGIGDCQKIPVFCKTPDIEIKNPAINKEFLSLLIPYKFKDMQISLPRRFSVVNGVEKRYYYKKWKSHDKGCIVYINRSPAGFFTGLFPDTKKQGIKTNFNFIEKTMFANLNNIKDIRSAFFMVMKGILVPDLGDQKKAKMVYFEMPGKKGFINYNLNSTWLYFDCNIFDQADNYFKVYIKDKDPSLDLDKVLSIISSVEAVN